jgi:hypothetical protein
MSWLSSFLHPEKSFESAQKEREKYYNQGQGYLDPYNQHGQETYGKYSGAMDKLLNPAALQDEWNKNYKESDFAKQNEAMASQSGLNTAQQMGLGGSAPALQAIQSGTAGIVAKDRQQYLDDLMQKYMTGIGIGQDIYGKGANAAGQMSQNANTMGQDSSQLEFNKKNAQGDLFGKLLGGGAALVGGALGGPIGGALGAGLAQHFNWSPKGSYNPSPYYTGGK